jgi:hypothetical protein
MMTPHTDPVRSNEKHYNFSLMTKTHPSFITITSTTMLSTTLKAHFFFFTHFFFVFCFQYANPNPNRHEVR